MIPESTFNYSNKAMAYEKLKAIFFHSYMPSFNTGLIEAFSLLVDENIKEYKSSNEEQFIAIEGVKHKYYDIISSKDYKAFGWGKKPNNYFFGLQQSLDIVLRYNPNIKNNIVLCKDIHTTLAFLFIGVPAILVDPSNLWTNSYFKNIISSLFSNIIVTYKKGVIPKSVYLHNTIKYFDLLEFLKVKQYQPSDFISYCLMKSDKDNFLEPLWDLYEYIDDDNLIEEEQGNFKIVNQ